MSPYMQYDRKIGGYKIVEKDDIDMLFEKAKSKKGIWREIIGAVTPGGDPAWKCPFCNKGIHVYGIENIEYPKHKCDNCGAELKYPGRKHDKQRNCSRME